MKERKKKGAIGAFLGKGKPELFLDYFVDGADTGDSDAACGGVEGYVGERSGQLGIGEHGAVGIKLGDGDMIVATTQQ